MMSRLRGWFAPAMVASSLALVVLLPIQILSWVLVGDPTERTTQWVADRWANPLWRTVDWVFLVVAVAHGVLGLARWLATGAPRGRVAHAGAGLLLATVAAVLVLATYTFFTFEIAP